MEQFGVHVSNVRDLPTEPPTRDGQTELERFVETVRTSGAPAKSNLRIRPQGGSEVFKSWFGLTLSSDVFLSS